jgi:hypothetical protein
MTALYPMLKFGHFMRTVRSDDIVSALLNVNEKARFYKIFKNISSF